MRGWARMDLSHCQSSHTRLIQCGRPQILLCGTCFPSFSCGFMHLNKSSIFSTRNALTIVTFWSASWAMPIYVSWDTASHFVSSQKYCAKFACLWSMEIILNSNNSLSACILNCQDCRTAICTYVNICFNVSLQYANIQTCSLSWWLQTLNNQSD